MRTRQGSARDIETLASRVINLRSAAEWSSISRAMRSKPFSIFSRITAPLTPRRSIKKQASAITASQVRNGEAKRGIAPPSRHGPGHPRKSRRRAVRYRSRFRSRFSEPFQMSGMAGVIFRPAFDDATHILDQIEGGYAGLILAERRGQRFPYDLGLRNATLPSGCL